MNSLRQPHRSSDLQPSGQWRGWLLCGLATLLALYAFGLFYEGFVSRQYAGWLTYPFVDAPAAGRAYDQLPARASPADRMAAAERLTRADPADPDSWTAVAYADWLKSHRLSATGLTALDHSYAVSLFSAHGAVWRVTFCLQNWGGLTPQIRHDALAEANLVLADPRLGPLLRQNLNNIQDPAGRLTAFLLRAAPPAATH